VHTLPFSTAQFDFTTAQIVINCTLKYALLDILTPLGPPYGMPFPPLYDSPFFLSLFLHHFTSTKPFSTHKVSCMVVILMWAAL